MPCTGTGTDVAQGNCQADGDDGDTRTSPLDPDTDHGGVKDGTEDTDHDGTVDSGETDPNDPSDDAPSGGEGGAGACRLSRRLVRPRAVAPGTGGTAVDAGGTRVRPAAQVLVAARLAVLLVWAALRMWAAARVWVAPLLRVGAAATAGTSGYRRDRTRRGRPGGGVCSVHVPGDTNQPGLLWLTFSALATGALRSRRRRESSPPRDPRRRTSS